MGNHAVGRLLDTQDILEAMSDRHVDGNLKPNGYQQITSLVSAVGLTAPANARIALLQAEAQNIRWRDDGTNPTATVGMRLLTTDAGMLYTGDLGTLKFIQEAASATLNVAYYT